MIHPIAGNWEEMTTEQFFECRKSITFLGSKSGKSCCPILHANIG